jgi:dienelactone hydrolase
MYQISCGAARKMQELGILICLVFLFQFFALIRPLLKGLQSIEGLSWLPLLALGIIIAIFPAYGFRPECVPLLFYTIMLNVINIPSIILFLGRFRNDIFLERQPVFTFSFMVLLILAAGIAFYFTPVRETALETGGITTEMIRDRTRNAELFLRIYTGTTRPVTPETGGGTPAADRVPETVQPGPAGPRRPLMILVPPVWGSVMMIDGVCQALSGQGLTALTYSRRGFDSPAVENQRRFGLSPAKNAGILRALAMGIGFGPANAAGRVLEEERRQDIQFLLSYIAENRLPALAETDLNCIFIAGYGAGGAALVSLSASGDFIAQNPALKGIIAVESPLLPAPEGEKREMAAENTGWIASVKTKLGAWFAGFRAQTINSAVPGPKLPVLFILSDWIRYAQYRDSRYETILRAFHQAEEPAVLAAVPGAGPADYSDGPEKYPVYSVLFPGKERDLWKSEAFAAGTASLAANFAALVLAREPQDMFRTGVSGEQDESLPETYTGALPQPAVKRSKLSGKIHIETEGAWNLPVREYILGQ